MPPQPEARPDTVPQRERATMPLEAFLFLLGRSDLWWMVLAPLAINLLLVAGIGYWAWSFDTPALFDSWSASGVWWKEAFAFVGEPGLRIALTIAAVVLGYSLASTIASPFCDLMGERLEKELLADRPDLLAPPLTFAAAIRHAAWEGAQRLAFGLFLTVTGLLLGVIPCLGWIIGPLLTVATMFLMVNLDAISYPMDRRRIPLRAKLAYLRANLRSIMPAGSVLTLIGLPICCAPVFQPPIGAIMGTRIYCARLRRESPAPEAGDGALADRPTAP
ncbi:MAG: EI24 domain-containing protein [Candidatus Sumerlaeia bacterium]|nr:EI24 domain-containing protein [Candidatus Sumerlaeia bacterium]